MRKVDPIGPGRCPEGYEYVHSYKDKSGTYVRAFCRKERKTTVKLKMKMEYPGNTKISGSVRQGWRYSHVSETVPTQDILKASGLSESELKSIEGSDE